MSLISKFRYNKITVELHLLPSLLNIGSDSPGSEGPSSGDCRFIVTSANEYLVGARLPYFPRGGLSGPGPCNIRGEFEAWQSSGGWGGLSAGPGMIYPVQSLDGEVNIGSLYTALINFLIKVHRHFGGRAGELRTWITENISVKKCDRREKVGRRWRRDQEEVLCRTGEAVWTPIFCEDARLRTVFSDGIIHAVAPYDSDPDRDSALSTCYHNSLRLASDLALPRSPRVVTALLGTGVKQVSLVTSAEALQRALVTITEQQPQLECHLEVVLQPLPETVTEIDGVCRTLECSASHES